jgi:hypothetical protein
MRIPKTGVGATRIAEMQELLTYFKETRAVLIEWCRYSSPTSLSNQLSPTLAATWCFVPSGRKLRWTTVA